MLARAVYKALLRCYPAAFREEYGGQMLLVFSEQLDDARPGEAAALWARAAADAFTVAPKEHINVIVQDVRYALRAMAAGPGFAAIAVLSLALGIGANTAIFSLWNGVLNSALPGVSHPEQLVILSDPNDAGVWNGSQSGNRTWFTVAEFEQLREGVAGFSSLIASQSSLDRWQLRFEGGPWEEARGRLVSRGYFELLGAAPALGRVFTPGDERVEQPVAVISYNYWTRRFARDPGVLGRTVTVRNAVLTIIGVAPRGFIGETASQQPDIWTPLAMQPAVIPGEDRLHDSPPQKCMWLHVFGRLNPGVTLARAEAESNAVFKAGLETFYGGITAPDRRREFLDQRIKLRSAAHGASESRGDFSTSLTVLLAAVGLLLLIACANLANLLLARGSARRSEMALRISLGASRGRLVRQLVTESLVLAVMGGIAGLAAAWLLFGVLAGIIAESDRNFRMAFALDPVVLSFTVAVTLVAGLLFGLLPAWQAAAADPAAALNEHGRGQSGSLGRMRWSRSIVSLQLALSLPLLVGAGLLARTVYNMQHLNLGYPTDRLLLVGIDSRIAGYNTSRSQALFSDLLDRISRVPGVVSASFSHNGLFTGGSSSDPVEVEGYTPKVDSDRSSRWEMIGPGYFSTLGIPLRLGREIVDSDTPAASRVCVVNDAFAARFFEGRNPIGMHVTVVDENARGVKRTVYQVVGVSASARTYSLRDKLSPVVFIPANQAHGDNVKRANFLIRAAAGRSAFLGSVRRAIAQVDPALPISYARTFSEQMAPWTAAERATAQVAVAFGLLALALAAIGLYGVLSYGVARRRGEIAVRIALGADPGRIVGMVLRETGVLLVAGLLLGAGLTYAACQLIASQLFGVAPQDPVTVAAAVALLLLVAVVAICLPAQKAARLDPMAALRQE